MPLSKVFPTVRALRTSNPTYEYPNEPPSRPQRFLYRVAPSISSSEAMLFPQPPESRGLALRLALKQKPKALSLHAHVLHGAPGWWCVCSEQGRQVEVSSSSC